MTLTVQDIQDAVTAAKQQGLNSPTQILVPPKVWTNIQNYYLGRFYLGMKINRNMKKRFYKKYIAGKYNISSKSFYRRAERCLLKPGISSSDALQMTFDNLKSQSYKNDFEDLINSL